MSVTAMPSLGVPGSSFGLGAGSGDALWREGGGGGGIAEDGDGRPRVERHLTLIDVDADQLPGEWHLEIVGDLGAEFGAEDDQAVGLPQDRVDFVAGRPEGAERERVVF